MSPLRSKPLVAPHFMQHKSQQPRQALRGPACQVLVALRCILLSATARSAPAPLASSRPSGSRGTLWPPCPHATSTVRPSLTVLLRTASPPSPQHSGVRLGVAEAPFPRLHGHLGHSTPRVTYLANTEQKELVCHVNGRQRVH